MKLAYSPFFFVAILAGFCGACTTSPQKHLVASTRSEAREVAITPAVTTSADVRSESPRLLMPVKLMQPAGSAKTARKHGGSGPGVALPVQESIATTERQWEKFAIETSSPSMREYYLEKQEMEDLRADARVMELMDSLGKLEDAASDEADPAGFAQLCDDAQFAMDVFKTNTSVRGLHALKFRAHVELSLIQFKLYNAAQKDKSNGVKTVPEQEIYELLLLPFPQARKWGQRDPETGQLEFSIDDVIGAARSVAGMQFHLAKLELKLY
ncbi:MAG: hypothetical protein IIC01_07695 [Planctomycetes bacterium]|nr:hypothetical protein [Planctomycetota bacterium]